MLRKLLIKLPRRPSLGCCQSGTQPFPKGCKNGSTRSKWPRIRGDREPRGIGLPELAISRIQVILVHHPGIPHGTLAIGTELMVVGRPPCPRGSADPHRAFPPEAVAEQQRQQGLGVVDPAF